MCIPHTGACGQSTGKPLANLASRLSGWGLCASPTRNAETVKNHPRRIGSIECVKVNAGHVVIQKIVTLFQGEVNADAPDPFRIVFASLKRRSNLTRSTACWNESRDLS